MPILAKPAKIFSTLGDLQAIDEPAGIIRGVAVITAGTPSDLRVDEATGLPLSIDQKSLDEVKATAEEYRNGLKVKADHGSGIFAVTGYLRNFQMGTATDGQPCLRADLCILDTEPNKGKLFEMARKIPDTFGLSISCGGQDENLGASMALRCDEIYSADLVPEPAANPGGLFSMQVDAPATSESPNPSPSMATATPAAADPAEILKQCAALIESAKNEMATRFSAHEQSLAELKKMMASVGDGVTGSQATGGEHPDPEKVKEAFGAVHKKITTLATDLTTLRTELAAQPLKLAKEFAGALGLSPTQTAALERGGGGGGGDKAEDRFEKVVQKHFAATHSKIQAMSAAIKEDEAGYKAFMECGRKGVKYA